MRAQSLPCCKLLFRKYPNHTVYPDAEKTGHVSPVTRDRSPANSEFFIPIFLRPLIRIIKIKCASHHQYVCLGMVNMSFPRRRESRFPSGHYSDGKLCRAQKFIMIGIIRESVQKKTAEPLCRLLRSSKLIPLWE